MSVRVRPIFWHLLHACVPHWYNTDEVRAHLRASIEGVPPHFDERVGPFACKESDEPESWLLRSDEVIWRALAMRERRRRAADNDNL